MSVAPRSTGDSGRTGYSGLRRVLAQLRHCVPSPMLKRISAHLMSKPISAVGDSSLAVDRGHHRHLRTPACTIARSRRPPRADPGARPRRGRHRGCAPIRRGRPHVTASRTTPGSRHPGRCPPPRAVSVQLSTAAPIAPSVPSAPNLPVGLSGPFRRDASAGLIALTWRVPTYERPRSCRSTRRGRSAEGAEPAAVGLSGHVAGLQVIEPCGAVVEASRSVALQPQALVLRSERRRSAWRACHALVVGPSRAIRPRQDGPWRRHRRARATMQRREARPSRARRLLDRGAKPRASVPLNRGSPERRPARMRSGPSSDPFRPATAGTGGGRRGATCSESEG